MSAEDDALGFQMAAHQGIAVQGLGEVLADLRRSGLDIGYPDPAAVIERIPLVTRFKNERHLARWMRAMIQVGALYQVHENKHLDMKALLRAVHRYPEFLVSLQGKGRKELVEMLRWVQPQPKRQGLFGFMRP